MSNQFTKVGPPDKGDWPRKRGRLVDQMLSLAWVTSITNPLYMRAAWLMFWKSRDLEEGAEPKQVKEPWHGLAEAELTEEQEKQAISDEAWRRDHAEK